MLPIYLLIAYKYLGQLRKEKTISSMIKICALAIFFSTFALALAIAIINGFEHSALQKIQGINPQVIIESKQGLLNYKQISKVIKQEFPEVQSASPNSIGYTIIADFGLQDISNVIILKAVEPKTEDDITNLKAKIVASVDQKNSLENLLQSNNLIIGQKLAKDLKLAIGNEITLLLPNKINGTQLNFSKIKVFITGIFNSGFDEFDNKVIFCNSEFFSEIYPESGINQIGLKLKDNANEHLLIDNLKKRLKLDVYSWKELYIPIINAFKLEKYAAFLIFFLIILIAAINIISVLFMIIMYKKRDIAILESLGMSKSGIRNIFLMLGALISFISTFFGTLFALLISYILQVYPLIKLPDVYYSSHLPIKINILDFILIFIIINLLTIFISWLATKKIFNIKILDILKNET